ncbi:MAG: rhodanese-like domain-containing protein [Candidatus Binataceae bacterium]
MRRRYLLTLAAAVAILVASSAFAFDLSALLANHEKDNFKLIHVSDLERLMAAKDAQVHVYDADPPDERSQDGVIPGAKLLPSSNRYDVAIELPADKGAKLVFYCHNFR